MSGINVEGESLVRLVRAFHCVIQDFPIKHLGLPHHTGRLSKEDWGFMRMPNNGNKEVLNDVLQSIDVIRKKFFWSGSSEDRKIWVFMGASRSLPELSTETFPDLGRYSKSDNPIYGGGKVGGQGWLKHKTLIGSLAWRRHIGSEVPRVILHHKEQRWHDRPVGSSVAQASKCGGAPSHPSPLLGTSPFETSGGSA
ncbi:hypothetical protein QJS10_CPB11g00587 [Acorus calamus]|uniref:Uncharacterized protein n=1 Tax=Acorus calamus TaxID=4465 RepID=A0AAV9DSI2_ACOCL|nr:hypothetical protein QJS10_CPB11g00587 [Acorus calamus]